MSLVAKSFKIFRLTLAGDDENSDFITFNNASDGDFKDSKKEGAYILNLKRDDPEGIGNNQAAEVPDGNVQPLGIVEGTYIVTGFITNMRGNNDDGINAIISKLRLWKDQAQVINTVWEAGRFGFVDNSDVDNSLSPVGTGSTALGLLFVGFTKFNDYPRNRVEITLTFRRSRGIDI